MLGCSGSLRADVSAYIEIKGDTEDAEWEVDSPEYETLNMALEVLLYHAGIDLWADWAPSRRAVAYSHASGKSIAYTLTLTAEELD
jgi:hypothetical protein